MHTPYQSRSILDECLLSSSKWSAECIRERRFLQAMKHRDPLLLAWQTTVSRKANDAAVFDANGRVTRTFQDIEGQARAFEAKIDDLHPGAVLAVQLGNHEDWPAVFVACLRQQLVVLPLDQTVGDRQRNAALEICRASAVVSALPAEASATKDVPREHSPQITRLRTADA